MSLPRPSSGEWTAAVLVVLWAVVLGLYLLSPRPHVILVHP